MTYQFGDISDAKSRAARIRAIFTSGTTIGEHTEKCIREKVWTKTEISAMAAAQARSEVRTALGQLTAEGVPWAGSTSTRDPDSGAPVWRQMDFWSKNDFDHNYSAYRRRERANGKVAAAIARECVIRFGSEPDYLGDTEDGDA